MNPQQMKTAEQMAIAVLRGDMVAACQLADFLQDHRVEAWTIAPVTHRMTCQKDGLLAVFTTHESLGGDVAVDRASVLEEWRLWSPQRPMILAGMRVDLYELTDAVETPDAVETWRRLQDWANVHALRDAPRSHWDQPGSIGGIE